MPKKKTNEQTRSEIIIKNILDEFNFKNLVEKLEKPLNKNAYAMVSKNAWELIIMLASFEPYNTNTELQNNFQMIIRHLTTIKNVIEEKSDYQLNHIKNQIEYLHSTSKYIYHILLMVGWTLSLYAACMYVDAANLQFGFYDNVFTFWCTLTYIIGLYIYYKYQEYTSEGKLVAKLEEHEAKYIQTHYNTLNKCVQSILSIVDKQKEAIKNLPNSDHMPNYC